MKIPFSSVVDACVAVTCPANSHCEDDTVPEGTCVCDPGYQETLPGVCSGIFIQIVNTSHHH